MSVIEPEPSLRERIAESLRASVVAGELEVGTVYSVPTLAEQFGVSITPVREAMLDLSKEGLVEPVRNKGFRIRELSEQELDEITEVRLLLEPAAVAGLAGRLDQSELAHLRRLADRITAAAKRADIVRYVEADLQFHRRLFDLVANPKLTEIVMSLRAQSRLLGLDALARAGTLDGTAHEHNELIDALAAGDAAAAERILRIHLGHIRAEWAGK